jgi:hypothetical protein
MMSRSVYAGEIAVSSHSNGLIDVTDGGLRFGAIVTTVTTLDDHAETS